MKWKNTELVPLVNFSINQSLAGVARQHRTLSRSTGNGIQITLRSSLEKDRRLLVAHCLKEDPYNNILIWPLIYTQLNHRTRPWGTEIPFQPSCRLLSRWDGDRRGRVTHSPTRLRAGDFEVVAPVNFAVALFFIVNNLRSGVLVAAHFDIRIEVILSDCILVRRSDYLFKNIWESLEWNL